PRRENLTPIFGFGSGNATKKERILGILFGTRVATMPRTCSGVLHGRFYASHFPSGAMPRTCSGVLPAPWPGATNVRDPGACPGHPTARTMPVVETSVTDPGASPGPHRRKGAEHF